MGTSVPGQSAICKIYCRSGPTRDVLSTGDDAWAVRQYSAGRISTTPPLPHCCGQRRPQPPAVSMTRLHRRWKRKGKLITDQKDAALRVQSLLVLIQRENTSNHDFYLHRSPISSWWTSRRFPQFADRKKKFLRWRACSHIPKSAGIRVRCRNITNITPRRFIIVETAHGEPPTRPCYAYQFELPSMKTYYDVTRGRLY